MTVNTPFMSATVLDRQLRSLTPNDAAALIANRLENLRIRLVTSHGYLKPEDSAVCAIGSLITLLAGQVEDLIDINLNLDDGELVEELDLVLDRHNLALYKDSSRRIKGSTIPAYHYPYHVWLMDNTKMTFGEVKSLENGFESTGFDHNPAGLANPEDNGDVRHFYNIGVALRDNYSVPTSDLDDEYDDDDYDNDYDVDYEESEEVSE
jgi:hypothetical protein